jgi:hypothetical protein
MYEEIGSYKFELRGEVYYVNNHVTTLFVNIAM